MENMNERCKNPSNSGSIMITKSDGGGQNMILKKQRVKILQNILAMNAKHKLSFNRLLCLEARFHGISKQELASQLNEVCESLKNDESGLFVQGIENLQKELIEAPLRKMKPNSMHTGVNRVLVMSNPDQELSPNQSAEENNSATFKSNECKSSFSSFSIKNGGMKRKHKEIRKKFEDEDQSQKRQRRTSSSDQLLSNCESPDIDEKPMTLGLSTPFFEIYKNEGSKNLYQNSSESYQKIDKLMEDQTINSNIEQHISNPTKIGLGQDNETLNKLQEEIKQHKMKLEEKDKVINELNLDREEKQREIDRLKFFIERIEHDRKPLENELEECEKKRTKCKQAIAKYLRILQETCNKEKKEMIATKSVQLGQLIYKRIGSQFKQVWEDGDELIQIKYQLEEIAKERESLEKIRRSKKSRKIIEQNSNSLMSEDKQEPDLLFDSNNEFELTKNLCHIDEFEQKDFLTFKINMKQKEEIKLRERLEQIKKEKVLLSNEMKRQNEELNSTLCGKKALERYKILNGQYLVLSLLGKGGYSEVYKGYDLENCREVALKIHRFDETWSRSMQASYIKHALRENQTHQNLNHPRIVKHYDTIEMDNNSFCTVLELCTGPDLAEYLKINEMISEKEAKLIISQILSGLRYLNDHNPKIIHYDLKPQNILFHNGEIKISDFGLCKVVEDSSDRVELTSQGVGTYWYQPPECFEVGPNPPTICNKVDIWSLGIIFYEMLYGIRPFGHDLTQQKILESRAILKDGKTVNFPSKPNVSNECKEFIKKCLSYYFSDRFNVEEACNSDYIRPKKPT